jgi:hypothetical protein
MSAAAASKATEPGHDVAHSGADRPDAWDLTDAQLLARAKHDAPRLRALQIVALVAFVGAVRIGSQTPEMTDWQEATLGSPMMTGEPDEWVGRTPARSENGPLMGKLSLAGPAVAGASVSPDGQVVSLSVPAGGTASVEIQTQTASGGLIWRGKQAPPVAPDNFAPSAARWDSVAGAAERVRIEPEGDGKWKMTARSVDGQPTQAWAYVGSVDRVGASQPRLAGALNAATEARKQATDDVKHAIHKDKKLSVALILLTAFCGYAALFAGTAKREIKKREKEGNSFFKALKERRALAKASGEGEPNDASAPRHPSNRI